MIEDPVVALYVYVIVAVYSVGSVLTLGLYLYRGISYRTGLDLIGQKPPLQWYDWLHIGLDAIYILIAWPFFLPRLVRDD